MGRLLICPGKESFFRDCWSLKYFFITQKESAPGLEKELTVVRVLTVQGANLWPVHIPPATQVSAGKLIDHLKRRLSLVIRLMALWHSIPIRAQFKPAFQNNLILILGSTAMASWNELLQRHCQIDTKREVAVHRGSHWGCPFACPPSLNRFAPRGHFLL